MITDQFLPNGVSAEHENVLSQKRHEALQQYGESVN